MTNLPYFNACKRITFPVHKEPFLVKNNYKEFVYELWVTLIICIQNDTNEVTSHRESLCNIWCLCVEVFERQTYFIFWYIILFNRIVDEADVELTTYLSEVIRCLLPIVSRKIIKISSNWHVALCWGSLSWIQHIFPVCCIASKCVRWNEYWMRIDMISSLIASNDLCCTCSHKILFIVQT